ncbi:2031_t:CDS:2, partial [Funneliformis geosporum]
VQWREVNEKVSSLVSQLQEKKDELPKLEFELSKLEICVDVCVKSITYNETRIIELRQKENLNIERMGQLRSQNDHLTQELDRLKRQPSKINEEIKILQDKILEIGGKLRAQKSKIDHVKDQIVLINERPTKSQVAKSRAEKEMKKFENSLANNERGLEELNNEIENITKEIQQKANVARSIRIKADEAKSKLESKKEELGEIKEKFDEKTEIINQISAIEKINKEIHWRKSLSDLTLHEIWVDEAQEFQIYTDDELDAMDKDTLQGEIDILKDFEEITFKCNECKENYDNLRKQRLDEFMHGFDIISQKLKEIYQRFVSGGNAKLECDGLDPYYDGVVFSVKPPNKSWRTISDLSGEEKTLCSLALIFALHHYKSTPICVMDEIDAALDFRNVSIVANYIKERIRDAQFIVISLNDNMFELADHLVGVNFKNLY